MKVRRRRQGLAGAVLLMAVVVAVVEPPAPVPATAGPPPPNVVVIMTDDQTLASLHAMPQVQDRLVDEGVSFDRFVAAYPLCCPSRAMFLTGQYPQNNGVFGNAPVAGAYGGHAAFLQAEGGAPGAEATALPVAMQEGGYRTMHVGKYLNGYGTGGASPADQVPPGWDDWYALTGNQGLRYTNFTVNDDGVIRTPPGYQTDVLTDQAVELISGAAPGGPFFLSVGYFAPHFVKTFDGGSTVIPAGRHHGWYDSMPLPAVPSFNEANVADKPSFIAALHPSLTVADETALTEYHQRELEALRAVDEGVGQILDALAAEGELDNTIVVFTSDNGFFHGEHRIQYGKQLPYDASLRVPFIIRGPGIDQDQITAQLAANVDLVPTIAGLTGVQPIRPTDGIDLTPVLADPQISVERAVLLSSFRSSPVGSVSREARPPYVGIRVDDLQYVEYDTDLGRQAELYDLAIDPYQLTNRASSGAYAETVDDLAHRLQELRHCASATCPLPDRGFRDVPPGSPFHNDILWIFSEGISDGFPGQTYRPTNSVTRQAMAAFLRRLADSPGGPFPDPGFDDVPSTHPFAEDIAWLVDAGIAEGYSDGTFRPARPVTRQAMAAFLRRASEA